MSSCQVLAPISVGNSAAAFWPHYHQQQQQQQQQYQVLSRKKQWKCALIEESAEAADIASGSDDMDNAAVYCSAAGGALLGGLGGVGGYAMPGAGGHHLHGGVGQQQRGLVDECDVNAASAPLHNGGRDSSRHHSPAGDGDDVAVRRQHDDKSGDEVGSGRDGEDEDDASVAGNAQYLAANCVLVTYFNGEASRVVDEHFSRALGNTSHSRDKAEESLPLAQRNFPPSFWNSNHQYPPMASGMDLYSSMSAAAAAAAAAAAGHHHDPYAGLHSAAASSDPWQSWSLAASGGGGAASAAYSSAAAAAHMYSARLAPQSYSSLLFQGRGHASHHGHHAHQGHHHRGSGLGKPPDAWAGTGHASSFDSYGAHYSAMTGLEGPMQSTSKDLYWF